MTEHARAILSRVFISLDILCVQEDNKIENIFYFIANIPVHMICIRHRDMEVLDDPPGVSPT